MKKLELLKNKIKYRSMYRGTKEMDILLSSFVVSVINSFSILELQDLEVFLNCEDEDIYSFYKSNKNIKSFNNKKILELFKNHKI
jgi:antitoxin CptB